MNFPGKVVFHKIVSHKISRRNDPSWSKFGCQGKKLWPLFGHFMRILWIFDQKSKFRPPKWIFRGKWCSTKFFPIKFHGEMTPRGQNLAVKEKSYDHFLIILCEFSGFLTKNRLFDPLQGVLNIERALNWIYLVKLTHGKVFKSHFESKYDP